MLEFAINGEVRPGQSGCERWGELLESLETGDGPSRSIVTAVRIDGVAVPTFRTPAMLQRAVSDFGRVEVTMSTLDELVHESARVAYESIASLQRVVAHIAAAFHDSDPDAARRQLPSLTAALRGLALVTAMLTNARTRVDGYRSDFDRLASRLCSVLDRLVDCQTRQDWNGVAEVLKGALSTALMQWAWVLLAMTNNRDGREEVPYYLLAVES